MWLRRLQCLSVQFPHVQHGIGFSEGHEGPSGLRFALRGPQFSWGGGKAGGHDSVRECREGCWSLGQ